ncbi:MAG: helix-turn-helix domain-containing protein [Chlamydiia bacterium]|nr:helix-turn-helix domain-containing protein [Chlamydiia bacterium]
MRKKIKELREKGIGSSVIARQMNIGRSTVYKITQVATSKRDRKSSN